MDLAGKRGIKSQSERKEVERKARRGRDQTGEEAVGSTVRSVDGGDGPCLRP